MQSETIIPSTNTSKADTLKPVRGVFSIIRVLIAGILMGLANLVPGVSGGTMVLVMGLYEDFVAAIADIARLRFRRHSMVFLVVLLSGAVLAVASLAGPMSRWVTLYPQAMFSLFVGMTLGGIPTILRMLEQTRKRCGDEPRALARAVPRVQHSRTIVLGIALGFLLMIGLVLTQEPHPDKEAIRESVAKGTFVIEANYVRDVVAGVIGLSAMVLPGISGAYMFLILGRYETILASIALAKDAVISRSSDAESLQCLHVLIPVALGALIGLVVVSNLLKWVLHRYPQPALGVLLGIVAGSVVGIWPFTAQSSATQYATGGSLIVVGFTFTAYLGRKS